MITTPRTPKKLHQGVTALCQAIKPGATPIYVPVQPLPGVLPNDCFLNVRTKIATHGGTLIHGWRIWEVPGLFIEGEFHGIWLSPAGQHIDVTPIVTGENMILFLPDAAKTFDEQAFNRRDNIRIPLKDHPAVHAFIAHCEKLFRYEEEHTHPLNRQLFAVNQAEYNGLLQHKADLRLQMESIPTGRNDACPCGSGLKFKKCCGN